MLQLNLPIPQKEKGGSHQGGNQRVKDHRTQRINLGDGIVKDWEDKWESGLIPYTLS